MMRQRLLQWTCWFFLLNALLFWLIGLRFLYAIMPLTLSDPTLYNQILVWGFLLLAFTSYLAFLALLPGLLLVIPFALIYPHRAWTRNFAILIATLAAFMVLIDTWVYSQFHFHLQGIIWQFILSGQSQQIFHFSWLEKLELFLAFGFIIAIEICLAKGANRLLDRPKQAVYQKRILAALAIALFLTYDIFLLAGINTGLSATQQTRALPFFSTFVAATLPIPNSVTRVENLAAGYFAQPKTTIQPLRYPLKPLVPQLFQATKPLNLVLIVIDSWRFDMLTAEVMPNVTQFAKKAWQFQRHFSGGNATLPGIFSLFYSLPSTYAPAMLEQKKSPVLIQTLLAKNYQMNILASAEMAAPPLQALLFREVPHLSPQATAGATPFIRDQTITRQFQTFLQQRDTSRPFFTFLFYDAAHAYCEPGNPIARFQPSQATCNHVPIANNLNPKPYFNRYKNALFFIDQQIAEALLALQQHDLLTETVVIITGDHGQEFNDNQLGFWEHASNFTRYQTQVPFVLYWPKKKPNTFQQVTSHYDVVPTLFAQLFGYQGSIDSFSIGQSLYHSNPKPYLIMNSYIDFAIIEPQRITTVFATGGFLITDHQGQQLPNAQLPMATLQQALKDLQKYYVLS